MAKPRMPSSAEEARSRLLSRIRAKLPDAGPLRDWVEEHVSEWEYSQLESVLDYDTSSWEAYKTIHDEFGSLWPKLGGRSAQIIVQRYLMRLPKIERNGVKYDAPYSLGAHLAALRAHREAVPF